MQVSLLTAADFWRSKSIPEKGIPAFKTSDGPNGARGAIFKAGTKVWETGPCVMEKRF
jgi:beta-glucosidase